MPRLIAFVIIVVMLSVMPGATLGQDEEVTLRLATYRQDIELDAALAFGHPARGVVDNLFLGLTAIDPFTSAIVPQVATQWDVSDDGRVWTFYLRDDLDWWRYDPQTEEAENVRPVVAADFAYALERACDADLDAVNLQNIAPLIDGCATILEAGDYPHGAIDGIQVVDDLTLRVRLTEPAGYFLSISAMPEWRAVPPEVVEAVDGFEPGVIITNGPYFLAEYTAAGSRTLVRNPAFPADLRDPGNIDRVIIDYVDNNDDRAERFLAGEYDAVQFSGAAPDTLSDEVLVKAYDDAIFYYGFAHERPPFDDVLVRRAFSAIIDRESFIEEIREGRDIPMTQFVAPDAPLAPDIDDVGLGYDPDYARELMAAAGYPACEGFPLVEMISYTNALDWLEFWVAAAERELGCDPDLFDIRELDFTDLLVATSADAASRPHAWTLGWGPYFPDPHSWFGDLLEENRFMRAAGVGEALLAEAALETDPVLRRKLYIRAADSFFGPTGDFFVAPLFARTRFVAVNDDVLSGPIAWDGLVHFDAYTITR